MNNAQTFPEGVRLGAAAGWNELVVDRSGFQREFVRLASECPQISRRVLDIGCGARLPDLARRVGSLDGVDPNPGVIRACSGTLTSHDSCDGFREATISWPAREWPLSCRSSSSDSTNEVEL